MTEEYYLDTQRRDVEEQENWRGIAHDIPTLRFKPEWSIKIIPPVGGAMIRFTVKHKDITLSIYYDVYDRLGWVGEPYWELYPIEGMDSDTKDDLYPRRYLKDETEELLEEIENIFKENN